MPRSTSSAAPRAIERQSQAAVLPTRPAWSRSTPYRIIDCSTVTSRMSLSLVRPRRSYSTPSRSAPDVKRMVEIPNSSKAARRIAKPPGRTGRRSARKPWSRKRSKWPALMSAASMCPSASRVIVGSPNSARQIAEMVFAVPEVPMASFQVSRRKPLASGANRSRAIKMASFIASRPTSPSPKIRPVRPTQPTVTLSVTRGS